MALARENKGIPVFHIDFYKVASVSSSIGHAITELARKGEGEAHVTACGYMPKTI